MNVCTVYILMDGCETFYQDFYADFHPGLPPKAADTRQFWLCFWKVFAT